MLEFHSSYLIFDELKETGKKTTTVIVRSRRSNTPLGEIRWFNHWRQYCFYPLPHTVFNHRCLEDISFALKAMNAEHRRTSHA